MARREHLDWARYLDTERLADALEISERTLWRRVRAGALPPPTHPGKPHRWDLEAVIEHVERHDPAWSLVVAGAYGWLRGRLDQWRRITEAEQPGPRVD